jgi:hypothetical protein
VNNIVFILGAGASRHCGGPLMDNFLDIAKDIYLSGRAGEKADQFKLVFEKIGDLQSVFSKGNIDDTNIEAIFSAFEFGGTINKLPNTKPENIAEVINALKEVIVRTLEVSIKFPVRENGDIILPPHGYEFFADFIFNIRNRTKPKYNVDVLTFNYDIAVDLAIQQKDLRVDYAFNDSGISLNPVYLHKLHGSLNWYQEKGKRPINDYHPIRILKDFTEGDKQVLIRNANLNALNNNQLFEIPLSRLLEEHRIRRNEDMSVGVSRVIVPPSIDKNSYYEMIVEVWKRAAKKLGEADFIFIIGYSFPETDQFFKYLYSLGTVGERPLRKIVVYNTDKTETVDKRFRKILGQSAIQRYEYQTTPFEELFDPRNKSSSHIMNLFKE